MFSKKSLIASLLKKKDFFNGNGLKYILIRKLDSTIEQNYETTLKNVSLCGNAKHQIKNKSKILAFASFVVQVFKFISFLEKKNASSYQINIQTF